MKLRRDRNNYRVLMQEYHYFQSLMNYLRIKYDNWRENSVYVALSYWMEDFKDQLTNLKAGFIPLGTDDYHLELDPIIDTATGRKVNLLDPDPAEISIEDIARGLCHESRFAGQTYVFYSVADHSVRAAELAPDEHAVAALLHDASEAYLKDIPKPLKQLLPNYKAIEHNLMKVIAQKFGFEYPLSPAVKDADGKVLFDEWECFRELPDAAAELFTGEDNCGCPANANVTPAYFMAAFMECQKRERRAKERKPQIESPVNTKENED